MISGAVDIEVEAEQSTEQEIEMLPNENSEEIDKTEQSLTNQLDSRKSNKTKTDATDDGSFTKRKPYKSDAFSGKEQASKAATSVYRWICENCRRFIGDDTTTPVDDKVCPACGSGEIAYKIAISLNDVLKSKPASYEKKFKGITPQLISLARNSDEWGSAIHELCNSESYGKKYSHFSYQRMESRISSQKNLLCLIKGLRKSTQEVLDSLSKNSAQFAKIRECSRVLKSSSERVFKGGKLFCCKGQGLS